MARGDRLFGHVRQGGVIYWIAWGHARRISIKQSVRMAVFRPTTVFGIMPRREDSRCERTQRENQIHSMGSQQSSDGFGQMTAPSPEPTFKTQDRARKSRTQPTFGLSPLLTQHVFAGRGASFAAPQLMPSKRSFVSAMKPYRNPRFALSY